MSTNSKTYTTPLQGKNLKSNKMEIFTETIEIPAWIFWLALACLGLGAWVEMTKGDQDNQ